MAWISKDSMDNLTPSCMTIYVSDNSDTNEHFLGSKNKKEPINYHTEVIAGFVTSFYRILVNYPLALH